MAQSARSANRYQMNGQIISEGENMSQRGISRVLNVPPVAPGFVGPGHLAAPVVPEGGTLKRRQWMTAGSLNECGDDLVPTEGWGDRSQNCLHDMRIVGNT
jgi:hypothetical protein